MIALNILIMVLIVLFGLYGLVAIVLRWLPIVLKRSTGERTEKQSSERVFCERFCSNLTPEVVERLKAIKGEGTIEWGNSYN